MKRKKGVEKREKKRKKKDAGKLKEDIGQAYNTFPKGIVEWRLRASLSLRSQHCEKKFGRGNNVIPVKTSSHKKSRTINTIRNSKRSFKIFKNLKSSKSES
jgi:hypothetical protein